jgi:isopentenyl-diphosphate delta-isomerase
VTDRNLIPAWLGGKIAPVDKLEVHQRGLRHKAVSVFVMAGNKTLIQQRALSKYHTPGLWANTCCTHPLWDEHPDVCAVRRIEEELGITGLTPVHKSRVEYRAEVGQDLIEHEVVDIYVADADESLPVTCNPDEVAAVRWVDLEALEKEAAQNPERFTPWLKIYLETHRSSIFGEVH